MTKSLSLLVALAVIITLGAGCVKKTASTIPDETPKPQEETATVTADGQNEQNSEDADSSIETETEITTETKTETDKAVPGVSEDELNKLKSEIEKMQFDDLKGI